MLNNIHLGILDEKGKEIFPLLSFVSKSGFYLAGGTALALQLGHRTSLDFDFYSQRSFKKGKLRQLLKENMLAAKIKVLQDTDDTFETMVDKKINISFFHYDYPMLEKFINVQGILLASLKDIAAMKIVAISQRGKRRDFIDIFYLLNIFSLEEILKFTQKKYTEFDIYHGLRGLVYFKDADDDPEVDRIRIFNKKLTWEKVKTEILKKVKEFQSGKIRK